MLRVRRREMISQKRKLLFVPYCILIVPVLVDAIRLSIKNRDVYFMSHFLYTEYVFVTICVYVLLKIFKVKIKEEKTYGKKVMNLYINS